MTCIADFETLLKQAMGLDAVSVGASTIQRAIQCRMSALGLSSLDTYFDALQWSLPELQELIEAVVVPETWFFRDPDAFAMMARFVTKERLADRPADVVRLLSIPCSTGEEPYSMVMALLDAGLPAQQIKADAVDISKHALTRAQEAVYGRNSFRNSDAGYRERHFRPLGPAQALSEVVKGAVSFHSGNLVLGLSPSLAASYDVVFCRNLLIYFDRATQEAAIRTLGSLVAPAGLLFVSPAEAYLATSCGFSSASGEPSSGFRKTPSGPSKNAPKSPVRGPLRESKPRALPLIPNPDYKKAVPAPVAAPETRPDGLADAQRLGDLGRLKEAIECCERSIAQDGPSAQAYYLMGVARDAAGDRKEASDYYRRALYLDPVHIDALSHLALLMETQGDPPAARRLRERAQRATAQGKLTRHGR